MPPFALLSLIFGLFSPAAQAAAYAPAPSGLEWFTLSTPHFRLHHPAPLETYARALARSLERALPLLESDLHWRAPAPVDIVVMDPADDSNGYAVSFPNTHIELLAAPFRSDSELAYYVDWADELATHELTHIVANDTAAGFYLNLRRIFGSWIKPNGVQPVWLVEGLAVYEETRRTPGGRGRSPLMGALLRQAAAEGKLSDPSYTSLDRLNEGNPWWPGGSAPYFLGYSIQALGAKDHPGLPGDLSANNARRIPVITLQRNVERLLGRNWGDVWAKASESVRAELGPLAPRPEPCRITSSGRTTGGAALSPDGWIYYAEDDFTHGRQLARVRADAPCGSARVERLYLKWFGGATQTAVNHEGSLVAFAATEAAQFERSYSDLYLYDVRKKSTRQLTHGARARDPAFAGGGLFYIGQQADTSQAIYRFDLGNGTSTRVWAGAPLERLAGLTARNDTLLFTRHDNRGHDKIYRLPVEGGEPTALLPATAGREFERNPYLAGNGDIYFAYAQGSTQSIRRWRAEDGTLSTVAVSPNGLLDRPIPLPGGRELLVQSYDLGGLNLARVPLVEEKLEGADTSDLHASLTGEPSPPVTAAAEAPADFPPSVPYRALKTPATSLWPHYWLPALSLERGGVLLGASTTGNDPLSYHRYGLVAQWDSRATFPVYRAYYQNRQSTTHFNFELSQTNNYLASSKTSNRRASYSAEARVPLGGFSAYTLGAAIQERTLFGYRARNVVLGQSYRYDKLGALPAAMSENFGTSFRFFFGVFPNSIGDRFFVELRPDFSFFMPGFRPNHSVGFQLHAGYSTNQLLPSNYYQGGGVSFLSDSTFVVRGYPIDALLGQQMATANFSYTLPLAYPYRGYGLAPGFLRNLGLRFLADVGSANRAAWYSGGTFLNYKAAPFGKQVLWGLGVDLVAQGSVLYHVPISTYVGLHYGPQSRYGGGLTGAFGLRFGLDGPFGDQHAGPEHGFP